MEGTVKRKISFMLILILAVFCISPENRVFAEDLYSDIEETACEEAVKVLSEEKIINGYEDGTFRPENYITRAEVSKIFGIIVQKNSEDPVSFNSIRMKREAQEQFSDLQGVDWAHQYIGIAAACGIVKGYEDQTFLPNNNITYNELATMAVRACNYDMTQISAPWPDNYISGAETIGIFNGMDGFSVGQDGSIRATRGNVAIAVHNILDNVKEASASGYYKADENDEEADSSEDDEDGDTEADETSDSENVKDDKSPENEGDEEDKKDDSGKNSTDDETDGDADNKDESSGDADGESSSDGSDDLKENELSLTLDEAVTIMQTTGMLAETSVQSKANDEAIIKGYKESASSISDSLDLMNSGLLDLNSMYQIQQQGGTISNLKIVQLQREFAEVNLDANVQADMNNIEQQTRTLYFGLIQAQKNVELLKASLERKKADLEILEKKHAAGEASDIEVASQKSAITSEETSLTQAEQTVNTTQMSFNMLMNLPEDTVLSLTTPVEMQVNDLPPVDEAIESMLNTNLTLKYYDYLTQVTEIQYNALRYTVATTSSTYKQAGVAYEQSKMGLSQSINNMKNDMRTDYLKLNELKSQIDNFETTIELAEKSLEITKVQYDLGMAIESDVKNAEFSIKQAEMGLLNAIITYNTAISDLKFAMGVGTERVSF